MITSQKVMLTDIVVQGTGNVASDMDGEMVLLSVEKGKYYNLGKIGGRIWRLIETSTSVHELVANLMSEYEVEQSVCLEQVLSFLEQLYAEELIQCERPRDENPIK